MKNYRDELVQMIKDMGQELIDRAETMVSKDCEMVTDFDISIAIPQPMEGPPSITWSTSTISKRVIDRFEGGTSATIECNIKAETVDIKEETGFFQLYYDACENVTISRCSVCRDERKYPGRVTVFPPRCSNCNAKMEQ